MSEALIIYEPDPQIPVEEPQRVSITFPTEGKTLDGDILFKGTATQVNHTIEKVEIRINNDP